MEDRKPRRNRGPSAFGNFDQSKRIAEAMIREDREADTQKTQRLRELRLRGQATSHDSIEIPAKRPTQ